MNPSSFDWAALAEFSIVGLLSGGLLSMIALGFVLIYKGTGVINFAMGEFMMLGAYFFYTANVMWGLPLAAALLLAFAAVAVMAAIIERGVLRPLAGQPVISVLMATIGLASALHGGVDAIWGGRNYEMPSLLPSKPFVFGDVLIPGKTLWSFVLAAAVIAGFILYFRFSRTGVAMRAAASDPMTAYVLGIDVPATQRLTWVFAGLVGALAGHHRRVDRHAVAGRGLGRAGRAGDHHPRRPGQHSRRHRGRPDRRPGREPDGRLPGRQGARHRSVRHRPGHPAGAALRPVRHPPDREAVRCASATTA